MLRFNSNVGRRLLKTILHFFLPNTCCACRRDLPADSSAMLCEECEKLIEQVGPLHCLVCGRPLPDGGAHCFSCRGSKSRLFKCKIIRCAVLFGPQVRALIHAFKYADQPYLADYLAQQMYLSWSSYPELAQADVLIPVPLHARKKKSRGYNQAELLALALGRKLNLPVDLRSLVRVRNTPSQTGFGRQGRIENMKDAFDSSAEVKGKTVLLIDDVTTTGATLQACAEALKRAGARKVMAYAFAREQ